MRFISLFLAAIALAGCNSSGGDKADADAEGKLRIAVSLPAIGRIVEQIGGDDVETVVLLPSGADPENYEPEMGAMKRAADAQGFFSLNTPGFERQMAERMSAALPQLTFTDLSAGIPLIADGAHSVHNHDGGDPHLLTSPENARRVAANAAEALITLNPQHADDYRRRAASLDSLLAARDAEAARILAAANRPDKQMSFVVVHPALTYFARHYGLRQIPLERDGKQPTPRQLEERLKEAERAGASLVVADRSHSPAQAELAAKRLSLKITDADFNAADFADQYISLARALSSQ